MIKLFMADAPHILKRRDAPMDEDVHQMLTQIAEWKEARIKKAMEIGREYDLGQMMGYTHSRTLEMPLEPPYYREMRFEFERGQIRFDWDSKARQWCIKIYRLELFDTLEDGRE